MVVWKEANSSGDRRQTECLSCYWCEEKRDLMLLGMWGSEMFHPPSHSYFYIKICHSPVFLSSHMAAVWWMCFLYPLRTNDPLFLTLWFGEFVYPGVHYSLPSPIVLTLPRREISNICGHFHGICFKCQQKLICMNSSGFCVWVLSSGAGRGRECFKWPCQAERQMWVFFDPGKDALLNASESSENIHP